MSERVSWIEHKTKKVLYVDFSNMTFAEEIIKVIHETKEVVSTSQNTLILFNIIGSRGSPQVITEFKAFLKETKQNIKKTSIYCTSNVHKIFLKSIRAFTNLDLQDFDTLENAKDHLTN